MISGGDQNRQSAVVQAKVSRVVKVFLQFMPSRTAGEVGEAIKQAIQVTGFKRPATGKQLQSEWNGLAYFALDAREVAVQAIEEMEAHGLGQVPGSFRSLRKLVLPEYRRRVAQAMIQTVRTQQNFEAAVNAAYKDMLVSIHWRTGNPKIEPAKRMFPSPPEWALSLTPALCRS